MLQVLLILDNHSTHVTLEAVEFARENHIDILTLPSHTSHKMQPLDVGFFSPLKAKFNEAMISWQNQNRYRKPQELDIPLILRPAYENAAKPETAINSFRATGIWVPFKNGPDRAVFYEGDFTPEVNQEVPNEHDDTP